MKTINREIVRIMIDNMSNQKKQVLENAIKRNFILTSYAGLEWVKLTICKEGFYLEMNGCRSRFVLWCYDKDGELIEGRKPVKMCVLYTDSGRFDELF